MIKGAEIRYKVVYITVEGEQLDITGAVNGLNWTEGEKELASKIVFKVQYDEKISGMTLNSPIIIYADVGKGYEECIRGSIQKIKTVESNKEFSIRVECADNCIGMRQSQGDYYFTADHSSTEILKKILEDNGLAHEIRVEDAKHGKKIYRGKYIADMVGDVLKDLKEKSGKAYFVRSRAGVIEIIERGTNESIYVFDIKGNVEKVEDGFDGSKAATRVKVVGKTREEGHQHVDALVSKDVEKLGERTRIYQRGEHETLEEAEKAAEKLLNEQGIRRETKIEAIDVPIMRKGDKILLKSTLGKGYFYVKSINHRADVQKMTLSLDYDTSESEYDIAGRDELSE